MYIWKRIMEKYLFRRGKKRWTDFTENLQYFTVHDACFYHFSLRLSYRIAGTLSPATVHGSEKFIQFYFCVKFHLPQKLIF